MGYRPFLMWTGVIPSGWRIGYNRKTLFSSPIRWALPRQKSSFQTQAIKNSRGCRRIKNLPPCRGNKVRRHDGGTQFRAFGNDLKDVVGFFLGWENIAEFIEAEDLHGGVILDEGMFVSCAFEFGDKIETREEGRGNTFLNGLIAKG